MAFITLKKEDKEKLRRLKQKIIGFFKKDKKAPYTNKQRQNNQQQPAQPGLPGQKKSLKYYLLEKHVPDEVFYYRLGAGGGVALIGIVLIVMAIFFV